MRALNVCANVRHAGKDQPMEKVVEALVESDDVLDAQLHRLSEQLQLSTRTLDRRSAPAPGIPPGLVGQRLVLS
jgi:hypothetical protein